MSEEAHRRKNPFASSRRGLHGAEDRTDGGDDSEGQENEGEPLCEEVPTAMTESYSEIAYTHNLFGTAADETDGGTSNGNQLDGSSSSSSSSQTKKRPDSLVCDGRKASFPYNLEGTVRVDGNMTHFVAENLEYKIKLASPVTVTRKDSCNLSSSRQSTPSAATGGLSGLSVLPGSSGSANLALPSTSGGYGRGPLPYPIAGGANYCASSVDPTVLNEIEREAQALAASVDSLSENLCSVLHSISSITADNVEIYKNAVTKLTDCMDANIKCMYTIMAKAEEISKTMKPAEALAVRIREIKRLVDMFESNL
ncbi:BLOC-1-related complex subunit 6 [Anopheles ziemanni]|uniref:BLOC-1-related complex subunit 6 n=1 Tax=Anopheles coustani TaxID=139045 RepID=UPI00265912F5|nr:BLOC-1-related complex subunit 6 [Anopheles coustani]XP_058176708.1 BLOC-1-related complex subunit 6 [Anopheles ziemanni]